MQDKFVDRLTGLAYRHIFHASTFEETTELLLLWFLGSVDDKLGGEYEILKQFFWLVVTEKTDLSWASPTKELVKFRAREQQARAVAAVVEATARSRVLGNGAGLLVSRS